MPSAADAPPPSPGGTVVGDRRASLADLLPGLLADRRTRVTALDPAGFRVGWPPGLPDPGGRLIPVPTERTTMLDLVVASDRMAVVSTWELAAVEGRAGLDVHPVDHPERLARLSLLDARDDHGVWVGALTELDRAGVEPAGPPAGSLAVQSRVRSAVLHKNGRAVITDVDDRAPRMLGWSRAELIGVRSSEFVHPEDGARTLASWLDMLSTGQAQRVRFRHRCADGGWLWVEAENTPTTTGADPSVTTHLSDITEEMAAHEAVAGRERLFRRLTEALPVGVLRIGATGIIGYANAATATLIGLPATATVDTLLELVADADRPALGAAVAAALETGVDAQLEVGVRHAGTGESRRCMVSLIALTDRDSDPGALACIQDITDSTRLRDALTVRATFDALTGCHNRASSLAGLDHALSTAPAGSTGVVFIDLDHFKAVNDELGHAVGDELLAHVATALGRVVRPHDLVGRIGGDEFLLVLIGIDGPAVALGVARRAASALNRTVNLSGLAVRAGASLGVACSRGADTAKTLIARADTAMYASKIERAGRPHLDSSEGSTD